MLRYNVVLLVGLWAAAPASAANWADGLFDELSKDFGAVPRGPALTHPFRLVNKTSKPIHIAGVRVSCGCTTAQVLKPSLSPGEETVILARMDTTRFTGVKTVTIHVQFDRPSFDEVRLWVQAIARDDFNLTPDTLAFGQVKRGSSPVVSATLTFQSSVSTQILDVRSETNYIQPGLKEVSRQANQATYQLSARLRGDAPVGKWFTDIWLKTNNPSIPQIRIPVTVEIESSLSISPEAVVIGTVKAAAESERRVIVRGVKPFKIIGIDGTDKELSVEDSNPDEKKIHVLTVKLKPARSGEVKRTVRVYTDLPEESEIDFRVSAQVMP
jgi:hypothetical protein